MQLYFIRHGQSINNAYWNDPNYIESPDPVLTEIGIAQAKALADHLEQFQPITDDTSWDPHNHHGFGVTHIYCSLMERAAHTASYTARQLGVPFSAWIDIHESGGMFGREGDVKLVGLPGKNRAWFEENIPELRLPDHFNGTGWWNRAFETEEECQRRAQQVWLELLNRHKDEAHQPEQRIAFFSHGGFFVHLMCAILNLPWKQAAHGLSSWFVMNNCAISRIDVRNGEVLISYLNRTTHLPSHLITG